jgi:phosphoribosylaminoimidazole carboxylase PurE protein
MGSTSDADTMAAASKALREFGIENEARVLSAHRTPHELLQYIEELEARGVQIIIAGAGMAAHLAGVIAGHTTLPVLGVPLAAGQLQGLDALLATVQMPGGVPVATFGIGSAGAKNAAYFAARMLGMQNTEIRARMEEVLESNRQKVLTATLPEEF